MSGSSPFFVPGPPAEIGRCSRSVLDFVKARASGRILDLGGGNGAYALELKRAGMDVVLAEKDRACLARARSHGLRVVDVNEEPLSALAGAFDTVLLIEVLEHVEKYRAFFAEAFGCARSRVLLTVPCNDHFEELFRYGITYNHIAVSDHENHFTTRDLETLFREFSDRFEIASGDYLSGILLNLLMERLARGGVASLAWAPVKALNRLGVLREFFPTRLFATIERR